MVMYKPILPIDLFLKGSLSPYGTCNSYATILGIPPVLCSVKPYDYVTKVIGVFEL